jgi:DNA-binding transcriptional LysR family regulator
MLDATRLRVLVAIARHGSVTAAAQVLNYAQPSISHHMARLESETGAKLMERSGRGIRLTEAGLLLAGRAEEILGRLDAAEAELAAHVGLRQETIRLAAFGSALGTLAASAGAALRSDRAKAEISLIQAEPADAVRMLRIGAVDVALIFRYRRDTDHQDVADPLTSEDLRYHPVLDEPVYLITPSSRTGRTGATGQPAARRQPVRPQAGRPAGQSPAGQSPAGASLLADCAGHRWIAGCERCQDVLIRLCRVAGFSPDIAVTTDDYVAAQALVAAGLGTAILPGLALQALRHPGVAATELAGTRRQVLAVTYGGPPEPPAASALVAALTRSAASYGG